jgi:hypothetical protein
VIPRRLRSVCALCGAETQSITEIVEHLEKVHGMQAQRWPDGGLVIDASDTPELLEER